MHLHASGGPEAGAIEHRWPEQCMEIDDVFADEVMHFGGGIGAPKFVEIQVWCRVAEVSKTPHVADRRIEPNIKILTGFPWNLETKVWRVATDVPVMKAIIEPLINFIFYGFLQRAAGSPTLEKLSFVRQLEEDVLRVANHRRCAREGGFRLDQVSGSVRRTALVAVIAILVRRSAFWTGPFDEPVCEEQRLLFIVKLCD